MYPGAGCSPGVFFIRQLASIKLPGFGDGVRKWPGAITSLIMGRLQGACVRVWGNEAKGPGKW